MKYRLLAALAAMCWSSAQADVRGLQIEDLVRMERVGAPLLSPDGKKVLYTVRVTDMEKNRGVTNLWMQDLSKPGKEQRLTTTEASELYDVASWGKGYFSIGPSGHLLVHGNKDPQRSIDLKQLTDSLQLRGIGLPILVRFPELLKHRLADIASAFQGAKIGRAHV